MNFFSRVIVLPHRSAFVLTMGCGVSSRKCPNFGYHIAAILALAVVAAWPYSGILFFVCFFNILAVEMALNVFLKKSTRASTVHFFMLRLFIAFGLARFVLHVGAWHLIVRDYEHSVVQASPKTRVEDYLRTAADNLNFPATEETSSITIDRGYYAIELLLVAIFYYDIKKRMFRIIQKSSECRVQNVTPVDNRYLQVFQIDKNAPKEIELDPDEFDSFYQLLCHLMDSFGFTALNKDYITKHQIFGRVTLFDQTSKNQVNELEEFRCNHQYTFIVKKPTG